jgi:hypothetical protein
MNNVGRVNGAESPADLTCEIVYLRRREGVYATEEPRVGFGKRRSRLSRRQDCHSATHTADGVRGAPRTAGSVRVLRRYRGFEGGGCMEPTQRAGFPANEDSAARETAFRIEPRAPRRRVGPELLRQPFMNRRRISSITRRAAFRLLLTRLAY